MAIDPMTAMALASTVAGFFGGGGRNKEQERLLRISSDAARRLHQFGIGVPGSDPGELAALAQDRALLGEQQLGQRNQLMGMMGTNPQMGSAPDAMMGMGSLATAQQMALGAQHSMQNLAMRREALGKAAGLAQSSAGLAQEQGGSQLPQMLGGVAQALAYEKAFKRQQQQGQAPGTATTQGTPGAGMLNTPDILNNVGRRDMSIPSWQWMQPDNGGLMAPGNEPGGQNTMFNQIRQAGGFGRPMVPMAQQIRSLLLPSGVRFGG